MLQETFDTVVRGLKAQGYQRSVNEGVCRYRGPDGLKCAAGHLIQDDEYDARMERNVIRTMWTPTKFKLIPEDVLGLVARLQREHDSGRTPFEMVNNLKEVAKEFNLEWNHE